MTDPEKLVDKMIYKFNESSELDTAKEMLRIVLRELIEGGIVAVKYRKRAILNNDYQRFLEED